ncbi:hypothetical protein MVEG_00258 [Podila verticillata NRRL 6337]|nr:hypothetical protein MVEG_00258 [Podila verticillata NRRL 6337]
MPSSITLTLISYAGTGIAFLFSTLSLACGLYYLAELVEEYTVLTKKIIKGLTVAVAVLHLALWLLDGFPFSKILFSLFCHAVYSLNLGKFPYISLLSLPFLASCALVLCDHFMWFQFFTRRYYSFMSIASFFGICVWMIPFAYFISLSANDNALPSFDKTEQSQKKNGILKSIFGSLLNKKEAGPVLIETPKYTGFGNSIGSRPSTPVAPSSMQGGYNGFNPDKETPVHRSDYPSRPGSSNSNYGHGHGHSQNNSPAYGNAGSQYSSSVYHHSSSVASRF